MKTIEFKAAEVAYQVQGKGKNIVLLHGFCEDATIWTDFQKDLLEENYRVITIDLPGFGGSGRVPEPSIQTMAEAVHAVITTLGITEMILIGHSMGGYVSLAYADAYPDQLAGLGLFHSHPFADPADKKEVRNKGIDFIQRHGHVLFVKQLIPKLFPSKFVRSNTFLVDKLIYRASKYDGGGIIDALAAMRDRPDRSDALRNISCPVLFIIGGNDSAIPHELSMEQTHLPQTASIQVLDKIGHMGMFEAERTTQKIVRDFAVFCYEQSSVS